MVQSMENIHVYCIWQMSVFLSTVNYLTILAELSTHLSYLFDFASSFPNKRTTLAGRYHESQSNRRPARSCTISHWAADVLKKEVNKLQISKVSTGDCVEALCNSHFKKLNSPASCPQQITSNVPNKGNSNEVNTYSWAILRNFSHIFPYNNVRIQNVFQHV